MKSMLSLTSLFILFIIVVVLGIFYRRYEDKLNRESDKENYDAIQNYLLDDVTLGKSKKPILWIHIPYEYNSRQWLSFGSRSSFDLNQPYLYLTVRSIIKHCDKSFTICIIDDSSFKKLIKHWDIDMTKISDPMLYNMRQLGLMKLLYTYGGMICPVSFLCLQDLGEMYAKGTRGDKMFICETVDRNTTSSTTNFYPNIAFCGAPKECETVMQLCNYIQTVSSHDYTAESKFLGQFDRWCMKKVEHGKINMINGLDIGTKNMNDEQILVDNLLSNHYLDLYKNAYGILIPAQEILNRPKYEWFARMSAKQVLESDTIIGNYTLLALSKDGGVLEPLEPLTKKAIEHEFVGFWRTPLDAPVYGLKPIDLGDNIRKVPYPSR